MEVNRVMGAPNTDFLELLHALIAKGTTPLFAVPDLANKVVGYGAELAAVVAVLSSTPAPSSEGTVVHATLRAMSM